MLISVGYFLCGLIGLCSVVYVWLFFVYIRNVCCDFENRNDLLFINVRFVLLYFCVWMICFVLIRFCFVGFMNCLGVGCSNCYSVNSVMNMLDVSVVCSVCGVCVLNEKCDYSLCV